MANEHEHGTGAHPPAHGHHCGNLFGCGDEKGTGVLREDIKDAAFGNRTADRLLHMDEMDQERLDGFLTARGRMRRQLLRASSFMGALAAVGPRFAKLAHAAEGGNPTSAGGSSGDGRTHVVESTKETVRLGVFDATLPPLVTIESGDLVSLPKTWSHFLNELQPGVPVGRLAELRTSNPGRGPHSISARSPSTAPSRAMCSKSAIGGCGPSRGGPCSTTRERSAPVCWRRISRKAKSNTSISI